MQVKLDDIIKEIHSDNLSLRPKIKKEDIYKNIFEEESSSGGLWNKIFGPPKHYRTTKSGEPGFRIETPIGTDIINKIKEEWETYWPDYVGLALTIGTYGVLKGLPALQERAIEKTAETIAKNNLSQIKAKYPIAVKGVEDAKAIITPGLKSLVNKLTSSKFWMDINPATRYALTNKILKHIEKIKLPAPKITGELPGKIAQQAGGITGGIAPKIPTEFIPAGIDRIREVLRSVNIAPDLKEEIASQLLKGRDIDTDAIVGKFLNGMEEYHWLPREEQQRAYERLKNEVEGAIEKIKKPEEVLPKSVETKKIPQTTEILKVDTWSDKKQELPEALEKTVKNIKEPIPLTGEIEKISMGPPSYKGVPVKEEDYTQYYFPGVIPPDIPPKIPDSFLPSGEEIPAENPRLGISVIFGSFEHWAMDIEHRTKYPVYTKVVRPQIEQAKETVRILNSVEDEIKNITKDLSDDEIDRITQYMKEKQLVTAGKMDAVTVELTPKEMKAIPKIRALFDEGAKIFGLEPVRYIEDYVPLLTKKEKPATTRAEIPLKWLGVPSEVEEFFKKARRGTEYIDDFNIIDLIRLYYRAGTWAKYRNTMANSKPVVNEMPPNIKNEILKWENFLTGGQGDFDRIIRKDLSAFVHKASLGKLPEDVDIPQVIVNTVYLGGLGLRPSSALKNLTQSLHNWSEMPSQWMAIGNKLLFSEEGQRILKNSGIMMGYAPYTSRFGWEPTKGEKLSEKFARSQAKARDIGMYLFQSADRYNRGTIYLAEWARVQYYADQLNKGKIDFDTFAKKVDLAGVHPTFRKFLLDSLTEVEQYYSMGGEKRKIKNINEFADALGDYRQMLTQYRYMKEVRPQWMRSGMGKIAGQFLTWPTYYARFQLERPLRAYEAFKAGKTKEGAYQLGKLVKYVLGAIAAYKLAKKAGINIAGWFKPIPTGLGPAAEIPYHAYEFIANKAKGFDWVATQEWWRIKNSWTVFVPGGLAGKSVYRAFKAERQPLINRILMAIGLPVEKRKVSKDEIFRELVREGFKGGH